MYCYSSLILSGYVCFGNLLCWCIACVDVVCLGESVGVFSCALWCFALYWCADGIVCCSFFSSVRFRSCNGAMFMCVCGADIGYLLVSLFVIRLLVS